MAQVTRRKTSGPGGFVRERNRGLVGIEPMVGTTRKVGGQCSLVSLMCCVVISLFRCTIISLSGRSNISFSCSSVAELGSARHFFVRAP